MSEVKLDWSLIRPYPGWTKDLHEYATEIYEETVCDARFRPIDVARMVLLIEQERRNEG